MTDDQDPRTQGLRLQYELARYQILRRIQLQGLRLVCSCITTGRQTTCSLESAPDGHIGKPCFCRLLEGRRVCKYEECGQALPPNHIPLSLPEICVDQNNTYRPMEEADVCSPYFPSPLLRGEAETFLRFLYGRYASDLSIAAAVIKQRIIDAARAGPISQVWRSLPEGLRRVMEPLQDYHCLDYCTLVGHWIIASQC